MKVMLTREDNDNALDEAYQDLEQLMEGRMTNLRKPKPVEKIEEQLEAEELGDAGGGDEIDEGELDAVLSKLG